jgi:hypothetical protein
LLRLRVGKALHFVCVLRDFLSLLLTRLVELRLVACARLALTLFAICHANDVPVGSILNPSRAGVAEWQTRQV